MKKKRIIWIDVLRLVGILMVLTIHVVGNTINTFGLGGNASLVYKVLSGISAASISLFVLISGGMFLGRDISYKDMFFKYIIKILVGIVLVGFVYSMMELVFVNGTFKLSFVIDSFVKIIKMDTWAHMWYLYLVLVLYLITPLLRLFVKKLNRVEYAIFLCILGIATIIIPEIGIIKFAFLGYVFCYLYGYYIYNYDVHIIYKILSYIGLIAGIGYAIYLVINTGELEVVKYTSLTALLISNGIFLLAKNIKFKESKITNYITSVGICSYGIYLIHQLFINIIYKLLKLDVIVSYPVLLIVYILVIFALSYICIYVVRKSKFLSKYLV